MPTYEIAFSDGTQIEVIAEAIETTIDRLIRFYVWEASHKVMTYVISPTTMKWIALKREGVA